MSLAEAREKLAGQQAAVLRALVANGPLPTGFDAAQVRAAGRALASKRLRSVQGVWPILAESLGDAFVARFSEYAANHALPHDGGPLADGWGFTEYLQARGEWPGLARLEWMTVGLRYARTAKGLRLRRWPALRLMWRPFAVGVRIPPWGEWWVRLG